MPQIFRNIIKCVFVFVILFLCTRNIYAEETASPEETYTFSFTVYPCLLPMWWLSAEGEYAFSEKFSIALEGKYWDYHDTDGRNEWKWKRLETSIGIRGYYDKVLEGFFVGAYLNYLYVDVELDDHYFNSMKGHRSFKTLGTTAWIGYKWNISGGIIEVSTGLSYYVPVKTRINVSDEIYGRTYTKELPEQLGLLGLVWPGVGLGIGMYF
ncbi:MAG TPA: DUF3575 domain-containing protein [Spirochaetota bacterium]|nr:DUF3575 domain-containing protein [Spirochaetota bacterium]HPW52014.1 DUF3575 domain-containing protein [Spirochaetota bacterium]HQE57788.1 DUF3575 domain-containing protein [Spirochaetota bacterium]